MLEKFKDTIVAVATPPGVGAINVIRVSGEGSLQAVDKIFSSNKNLWEVPTHTVHYGRIIDTEGETVDDVLVTVFRSPHSYTGEDSVEISTHGSPLIAEKIIGLLLETGVRLAEPGEFTRRAFLNGKLDLAQAEAVADIINARSDAALRGARNQLDGILSAKISELRDSLVDISSLVELELDFAEEDLEFVSTEELLGKIENTVSEIDKLLATFRFGRVIRDGVNVAIVGRPNVGKSSLLNYILKESRAIVSNIPGTTRDVIREEVFIDGILFRLYDTAGIRLTEDTLEREGVLRSREAVKNSDVVIFVSDVIDGFSIELYNELLQLTEPSRIIKVLNKIDLSRSREEEAFDAKVSALTGEGIEKLFSLLKEKALGQKNYTEKSAVVSNIRHYVALKNAKESLENAEKTIKDGMSGEFVSVDLRSAENFLGEIIGKVTTDDILNNIFNKFCIGK
jgi:tRNA modification GTPase